MTPTTADGGSLPSRAKGTCACTTPGGWVTYDIEDHPTCYLFALDEGGTEHLLDVSFKEVDLNGNLLLKVTSDSSVSQMQCGRNALRDLMEWAGSTR